ncbi:MAG: sigma-54-dependent Fis family transcriptional regulator [Bacteroidetes bacterium]|nr:sigma-54-dependent Fis family transcriptional regulator [Bacteroidota bacterium]
MFDNNKILICDNDKTLCYFLKEKLLKEGIDTITVFKGNDVIDELKIERYDILIIDLNIYELYSKDILKFVSEQNLSLLIIVLAAQSEIKEIIKSIKMEIYVFIKKPIDVDYLIFTIYKAIENKNLLLRTTLLEEQVQKEFKRKIIGTSKEIQKVITLANKSAKSELHVLLQGETGTGKELLAEYIHRNSPRFEKPFYIKNCTLLSKQFLESELFGYEKTKDQNKLKPGIFEISFDGTIFFDEVSGLSLETQNKILRIIQSKEFERIGGNNTISTNAKIILATTKNKEELKDKNKFSQELFNELNVLTISVPPLRNRKEDILILAYHFLKIKSPPLELKKLSPIAEIILTNYNFPGNIRELENIIERAITFASKSIIMPNDLGLPLFQKINLQPEVTNKITEILSLEEMERKHIANALKFFGWDRKETAYSLGISIKTLYCKIKKYSLKQ